MQKRIDQNINLYMLIKLANNKLPLPKGFDGKEWHYNKRKLQSLHLP